MIRRKSSPRRFCLGTLFTFFLLAFLRLAVREGDSRLYLLAAVVPSAVLLGSILIPRIFSADRWLTAAALTLCAFSILVPAPADPEAAWSRLLLCAGALIVMIFGTAYIRFSSPSFFSALLPAVIALALLVVPLLAGPVPFRTQELSLALLLPAYVSFLSLRYQLPAVLTALAGTALLLLLHSPVAAVIWSVAFLLLFWAYSGHAAILFGAVAVTGLLFYASFVLFPDDWAFSSSFPPVFASAAPGLFGPETADMLREFPEGVSPDLFSGIIIQYGWILSAFLLLLYPLLVLRGTSLACAARSRFHGLVAMGSVLLLFLPVLFALLAAFGIFRLEDLSLPLLTQDFPSLAASMFMIGLLSGVAGRNEKDLDEDSHLAMLAH